MFLTTYFCNFYYFSFLIEILSRKKVFANGEVPPSDSESETEDERAPLLARPRVTQSGTFSTQNENPFRRAARRLARAGGPSPQRWEIITFQTF